MNRAQILAIGIDKVTMAEAVNRCIAFIEAGGPHLVVTPNAEIAYTSGRDADLAAIVNGADLVVADGAGIVAASRILGDPVPEKVAGADLATRLVRALNDRQGRIYLLGAKPDVVREAARRLGEQFPHLTIFHRDGYFGQVEEAGIIADIRGKQPQALFVGMGSPRQEKWLSAHLADLNVPVSIGVGGTIDVWAGAAQRAPQWMINANLEWLYRIVKFGRLGRSLPPLTKFVLAVLGRKVRGGGDAARNH